MTANPIYDEMITMNGDTITLRVERTATAQDRDGLDTTFSQEAVTALYDQMHTWVGTRVLRHQQDTGLMPQTLTVTLTVHATA